MSPRLSLAASAAAAALTLGVAFALPAAAQPDPPSCPEGSLTNCIQDCPTGNVPASGSLCNLVRVRAKSEVLTQDQLLRLCADARARNMMNARIAVGYPEYKIITLDGATCGSAPEPVPAPSVPLPVAPTPVIVSDNLPVTH